MEFKNLLFGRSRVSKLMPVCRQCMQSFTKGHANHYSEQFYTRKNDFSSQLSSAIRNMCKQVNLLTNLFSQQCSLVASQRLRRAYQVLLLYRKLYGEKVLHDRIKFHLNKIRNKPLIALLSASVFQWDKERVTDEEIQRCREEMEDVHRLVAENQSVKPVADLTAATQKELWEPIVDKDHFKVWRRYIPETELYEYRVYGHFTDIPPQAFYNTQVDVEYWKHWDKQTMEVRIVDKDEETNSEVIHWVYKFPYPMYPRDYVYVRRHMADPDSNTMVITTRATDHPTCPLDDTYVRVKTYTSQMVIRPYTKFDENGFTYVLTYCDDPQTHFPSVCFKWMASTGVHEFLERVHRAALKKQEKTVDVQTSRMDNSSTGNIYAKIIHQ